MNIKEHIEAGHYPKDERGRAKVLIGDANEPGWNCGWATVLATDGCAGEEIIARFPAARACHWSAEDGRETFPPPSRCSRAYVLLPPPPRKVEVKGWAIVRPGQTPLLYPARCHAHLERGEHWVELTGSYEIPWDEVSP